MGSFIFWRLVKLVITTFVVLTLVFVAFRLVPGNPAQLIAGMQTQADVARVRKYLGLDEPIQVQYLRYIDGLVHGKLGVSFIYQQQVGGIILSRLPATLSLLLAAILLTVLIGIPVGVLAAVRQGTVYDYTAIGLVVATLSMPNFWVGLLLVQLLAVKLHWLPTSGFQGIASLVMPSIAVAARMIGTVARMTRATMLEVIRQEYVRTARAKGLPEIVVMFKHALRNALIPTVTIIGLNVGYLLGGSIVIEVLFAWPGIGQLLINAINMRDYNMVQGITVVFVAGFMLVNLLVDLLYGYLDPRIRAQVESAR